MEREELLGRARGALRSGPPLRLAVLFGSRSTRRVHPGSDADVAIVPRNPGWSLWEEGSLASELESALGLPVDLVRLDLAPTLLRWQIVKFGEPILEDPPGEWERLLIEVMAEHADFAPAAERVARSFLRQIAGLDTP